MTPALSESGADPSGIASGARLSSLPKAKAILVSSNGASGVCALATTRSRAAGSLRASAAPANVTVPEPASPLISAAGLRPVEAKSSAAPMRPENPARSSATESRASAPVSVTLSASRRSVAWPEAPPPAIRIAKSSRSSRPLSKRSVVANSRAVRASVKSRVPTLSFTAADGGRNGAGANLTSDQRAPVRPGLGRPERERQNAAERHAFDRQLALDLRRRRRPAAGAAPEPTASSARAISALASGTASSGFAG